MPTLTFPHQLLFTTGHFSENDVTLCALSTPPLTYYFISLVLWLDQGRRVGPIPGQDSSSDVAALLSALSGKPEVSFVFLIESQSLKTRYGLSLHSEAYYFPVGRGLPLSNEVNKGQSEINLPLILSLNGRRPVTL